MHTEKIPVEEYQRPPPPFNPVHVNADEWAQLMVDTGQRHLTITSKYHDGFSMFDCALTD